MSTLSTTGKCYWCALSLSNVKNIYKNGHSCSQHANFTLPLSHLCHCCDNTAHFRVAFYFPWYKVHLCNNQAVQSASWYATPVRWMDYLGRKYVLTNRDVKHSAIFFFSRCWTLSTMGRFYWLIPSSSTWHERLHSTFYWLLTSSVLFGFWTST